MDQWLFKTARHPIYSFMLQIFIVAQRGFANMAHSGTLKTCGDHGKQCDYGWIFQDHEARQAPLFVHIKQCNGATTLREGDEVTFDKKWNDVKGLYDIDNCTIIRASTTSASARSTLKFEND